MSLFAFNPQYTGTCRFDRDRAPTGAPRRYVIAPSDAAALSLVGMGFRNRFGPMRFWIQGEHPNEMPEALRTPIELVKYKLTKMIMSEVSVSLTARLNCLIKKIEFN